MSRDRKRKPIEGVKNAGNTAKARGQVYVDNVTIKSDATGKISAVDQGGGGGGGTVTSVGLTMPTAVFDVGGSPVTTSGTLAVTLDTQNANKVFAGPAMGADAAPTFRSLVAADLPAGTGTVVSVAMTVPSIMSVSGSPVTGTGTLAVTLATETANTLFAGPASGGAATPTFRAMVTDDLLDTGVTAGHYPNMSATVDAKGRITAATTGRQDGFVPNNPSRGQDIISGYEATYDANLDKLFFTSSATNGKLYYIDRITGKGVVVASYTSKDTKCIIYDPVSTRLYIGYGTTMMSVTGSTGAIVTAGIATRAENGMCLCTSNGFIYAGSTSGNVTRMDPSSDTNVGTTSLAGNFPCDERSVAYAPSSDTVYVANSLGEIYPIPCTTNVLGSIITNTAGSTKAAIIYCASMDRILYTSSILGVGLVIIDPNTNTVESTVAYPPGNDASNLMGTGMYELGDYVYIGTPLADVVIFHKDSETFVGSLTNHTGNLSRGVLMAGIVDENVLFVGVGASVVSTAIVTYRG